MYKSTIFIFILFCVAACQPPLLDTSNNTLILSLSRGPCLGRCAEFSLNIWDNGYVTFNGKENVIREGIKSYFLSTESLKKIEELLVNVDFYNLSKSYENGQENCQDYFTDHPIFILSAEFGSKNNLINVNTGCYSINEEILSLPTNILIASGAKEYAY